MQIALYRPEIPPNTGNIVRLCVCTGTRLHIVGDPSFSLEESAVRRAGLDYWSELDLVRHTDWNAFYESLQSGAAESASQENRAGRMYLFSRFAERLYSDVDYRSDDVLVFGRETSGLPAEVTQSFRERHPDQILRIPVSARCRSLNLGNAVALVLFEALRQLDFPNLETGAPQFS